MDIYQITKVANKLLRYLVRRHSWGKFQIFEKKIDSDPILMWKKFSAGDLRGKFDHFIDGAEIAHVLVEHFEQYKTQNTLISLEQNEGSDAFSMKVFSDHGL